MKRKQSKKGTSKGQTSCSFSCSCGSNRPAPKDRCFTSKAVDETIEEVKGSIGDAELGWLFENCYPNTLDTTIQTGVKRGRPDTFVITGDINAMWLRDSAAQVGPYLPLVGRDEKLKRMIAGVINRQVDCILIDPYANGFNYGPTGGIFQNDLTEMKPELHERKWEIDSLCHAVRLSHGYWKATGDTGCFDKRWRTAMRSIVKTFRTQQRLETAREYRFLRMGTSALDTLPNNGYGSVTKECGMIRSGFRPSDDACVFPFLVPANMFAVVALKQMAEMCGAIGEKALAAECKKLAGEVGDGVKKQGTVEHERCGRIYAYEVDGYGSCLLMDDANTPSLLALAYLGCCKADDETYLSTREFVLSYDNPYYYAGKAGAGIGGPHTGEGTIWPISIIMRALTSTDDKEIVESLVTLKRTHAGTGFMHESFQMDDANKFSRTWFAWANSLFGELIFKLHRERPELLKAAGRRK